MMPECETRVLAGATLEAACFYKTNVDKADLNKHKVRLDWKTGIAVRGCFVCVLFCFVLFFPNPIIGTPVR